MRFAIFAALAFMTACHPSWDSADDLSDALGKLVSLDPKVTVRRGSELAWQDAASNLPLFPFDAVRTYPKAKAKILLENGSELDLNEDSLIVLNPGAMDWKGDRATVRNGLVKGKTTSELWIMTSAALLKLKPEGRGKPASVSLRVEEGKKLEVQLDQGVGTLVRPNRFRAPEAVALTPGRALAVDAPPAKEDFGNNIDEKQWKTLAAAEPPPPAPAPNVPEKERREVSSINQPSSAPPLLKPLKVILTAPANYAEVAGPSVKVKGRVTRKGGEVRINGTTVTIGDNLEFSVNVPLTFGANTILVQLIKEKGESVFQRWTVIRKN